MTNKEFKLRVPGMLNEVCYDYGQRRNQKNRIL